MSEKSPDELIRLIQRKKAPAKLPESAAPSETKSSTKVSPFMEGLMEVLLRLPDGVSQSVLDQVIQPHSASGGLLAAAMGMLAPEVASAPPLTEMQVLQEIERQQKIARVRFRIKRGEFQHGTYNSHAPEYGPEQLHEVPCSKILWSIPLPGDREREVVQCAAGIDVETPVPWIPGIARVRLGCFPCVIFGFTFIRQNGNAIYVDWPQGFTKS